MPKVTINTKSAEDIYTQGYRYSVNLCGKELSIAMRKHKAHELFELGRKKTAHIIKEYTQAKKQQIELTARQQQTLTTHASSLFMLARHAEDKAHSEKTANLTAQTTIIEYYQQAIAIGCIPAMYNLGYLYLLNQNYKAATRYFKLACSNGDTRAIGELIEIEVTHKKKKRPTRQILQANKKLVIFECKKHWARGKLGCIP